MRVSTAVAALIGRALATGAEICGAEMPTDHTSLLQNLRIKNNVALQAVVEQQKTSADHMSNQALAMSQDVKPARVVHFVYSQDGVGNAGNKTFCLSVAHKTKLHDGAFGCEPSHWEKNQEAEAESRRSSHSLVPGCAGNEASDATLQVCHLGNDDQRFGVHPTGDGNYTLRSLLSHNLCLTVSQSSKHAQCEPLTLTTCADFAGGVDSQKFGVDSQKFVEETVTGLAAVKIWRNTATGLAIDVDSYHNEVDQWVWACPGSNAAKYWRPTLSTPGCWITPNDATNSWLRNINLYDYDETDHALRNGWKLDNNPNGGWRWCGITEKECQVACQDLGGCKAIYHTPNGCCFPSKTDFTGGSDRPGGRGGRKTYLQTENCAAPGSLASLVYSKPGLNSDLHLCLSVVQQSGEHTDATLETCDASDQYQQLTLSRVTLPDTTRVKENLGGDSVVMARGNQCLTLTAVSGLPHSCQAVTLRACEANNLDQIWTYNTRGDGKWDSENFHLKSQGDTAKKKVYACSQGNSPNMQFTEKLLTS